MSNDASISVVVPVYRSEQSLDELVTRVTAVLVERGVRFEVLFVDDGSPDDSWSVITKLAEADDRVRGVSLGRNYGQHNALLAGIRQARYDVVVTMDDDLQHPPEQIPLLLDALLPDVDLVYGYPEQENHSWARNVLSRATKLSLGASIKSDIAKHVSAFRAFRTSLRNGVADVEDPFFSLDVLLSWTTTRMVAIPVAMDERRYGRSNYSPIGLARIALNLVTGFSTVPLRVVTFIGVGLAGVGGILLAFVLGAYVVNGESSAPGFPFLAAMIAILSGAQLLALGVIGEYLGRVHYRSMHRPQYTIRTTTQPDMPDDPPSA
jgi:undecaprenyl-phosphate 4-deoxy-4-formamido-L-arabinose transferase